MLTNQEESQLGSLFKLLDVNGDGRLSKEELTEACSKIGSINIEEIEAIFENIDIDKSGFIDYSEFLAVSMTWNHVLKQEKIQMVYNYFDTEKNGSLSLETFKSYFPLITSEEWEAFLNKIDSDKSGNISLNEFRDYIAELLDS